MNRRHKACRAPRLQPASLPPTLPPPTALPPATLWPPCLLTPTVLLALDHPCYRCASELAPRSPGPPQPSCYLPAKPSFQRPTPPSRDLWPLEFSSRALLLRETWIPCFSPLPPSASLRQRLRSDVHPGGLDRILSIEWILLIFFPRTDNAVDSLPTMVLRCDNNKRWDFEEYLCDFRTLNQIHIWSILGIILQYLSHQLNMKIKEI